MMANYYEKLTRIFMVSDNHLFHAAAWNRYYALARSFVKSEEEHDRLASGVLLSVLAVPVVPSASLTSNLAQQKQKTDFLQVDSETKSKTGRLTALLGLSKVPTRAGLLKDAVSSTSYRPYMFARVPAKPCPCYRLHLQVSRNILQRVRPELRELYNILEDQFHPLSICAKVEPIIMSLAQDEELSKYVEPLHEVILARLFQQLSQVYDEVKLDRVMELVSAFRAPHGYDASTVEKFIMNACRRGHLSIRVDHISKSIVFQEDTFDAPNVGGLGGTSDELDMVKLQATPSDVVPTQLSRIATSLNTVLQVIDPARLEAAQNVQRQALATAVAEAAKEHEAVLARRAIINRRRELVDELNVRREKEDALARAERARQLVDLEARRVAEESRLRDQERVRKDMEAVRLEEAKKIAEQLKERGNLKVDTEVGSQAIFWLELLMANFALCCTGPCQYGQGPTCAVTSRSARKGKGRFEGETTCHLPPHGSS